MQSEIQSIKQRLKKTLSKYKKTLRMVSWEGIPLGKRKNFVEIPSSQYQSQLFLRSRLHHENWHIYLEAKYPVNRASNFYSVYENLEFLINKSLN